MAVDMFLKLEGCEGESQDDTHGGEIDILAWSWGCSNSGTFHVGGGGGSGKVSIQDLSVTKYVDKASKGLFQYACTGDHFEEGNLVVRKQGGSPLEFIKIDMKKVLVTSVSSGGSGGEDRLTENITLNFSDVTYTYVPQKDDGTGEADMTYGWDIAANTAL